MKRRTRALTRRLQSIRPQRMRRRPWTEGTGIGEPRGVSAAVLYTEPYAATATVAWLEPDVRNERTCISSQF